MISENERVEGFFERQGGGRPRHRSDHDLGPGLNERLLDRSGDLSLVFHDEDTHRG